MAGSRVIVHESVHDELVRLVAERANAIKLGDPNDPETEMGPIANQPQYEKVLGYLDTAQTEGATAACGGEAASELGGFFVKPTLFTGVERRRHRRARGGVRPGDGRADVPHRGGGAQARQRHPVRPRRLRVDPRRAARAPGGRRSSAPAPCGSTPTACSAPTRPFGGFGQSGLGRENGADALNEYTEVKSVWVELTGATRDPFKLG